MFWVLYQTLILHRGGNDRLPYELYVRGINAEVAEVIDIADDAASKRQIGVNDSSAIVQVFDAVGRKLIKSWSVGQEPRSLCWKSTDELICGQTDGKTLVSGSADGTIRLWRTSDGGYLGVLHRASMYSDNAQTALPTLFADLQFTDDGRYLTAVRHDFRSRKNLVAFACDW